MPLPTIIATVIDFERSLKIAAEIRAEDKMCWRNAIMAIVDLPETAVYVEGWAHNMLLTTHGWVELEDGTIIDPTPSWITGDHPTTYYPAIRYSRSEALERAVGQGQTLPLDRYMDIGVIPPEHQQIYRQAMLDTYGPEVVRVLGPALPPLEETP